MKWSELEAGETGCKVHPNINQLPGVCSFCLREKLSKLSNKKPTYPAPCSPPPSSSSAFVSPAYRGRHHRHVSSVMESVSSMISLKRSNTIAFASGSLSREMGVNRSKKESKKGGLWSKLLRLTRKNTKEASMHSETMSEGKG